MTAETTHAPRIPVALQAVFLASNSGKEVHTPPPERVAMKSFTDCKTKRGNFFFRRFNRRKSAFQKMVNDGSTISFTVGDSSQSIELNKTQPEVKLVKPKKTIIPTISPQQYLDGMLHSRNYHNTSVRTLKTAYYNSPTPLQEASYDSYLIELVRTNDTAKFRAVMNSGISPNPCNSFGESLLHLLCRRGNVELLQIMLDAGASVQVSDDYGRTPLHDAFWCAEPCTEMIELLLERDAQLLLMQDCRGAVPMSYIRKEHWNAWLQWLVVKKDTYWPKLTCKQSLNEVALAQANTRPMPDPSNALSLELASMVASGKMSPVEARYMQEIPAAESTECSDDDSDYDDDDEASEDSSYCSDDELDDDDEFDLDEEELAGMLAVLAVR